MDRRDWVWVCAYACACVCVCVCACVCVCNQHNSLQQSPFGLNDKPVDASKMLVYEYVMWCVCVCVWVCVSECVYVCVCVCVIHFVFLLLPYSHNNEVIYSFYIQWTRYLRNVISKQLVLGMLITCPLARPDTKHSRNRPDVYGWQITKVKGKFSNFKREYLENEDLWAPVRPLIGKRKQKYANSENLARGSPLRKNKFIWKTKSQFWTWSLQVNIHPCVCLCVCVCVWVCVCVCVCMRDYQHR